MNVAGPNLPLKMVSGSTGTFTVRIYMTCPQINFLRSPLGFFFYSHAIIVRDIIIYKEDTHAKTLSRMWHKTHCQRIGK